jgi:hypothetical protein
MAKTHRQSGFQGERCRRFCTSSDCLLSKQSAREPFLESSRLNHGALSPNDRKFFGPSSSPLIFATGKYNHTRWVCALFDNILQEQVLGGGNA